MCRRVAGDLKPVHFSQIRILGCHQAREINYHPRLFPGRIILHFAVNHDCTAAIRHGVQDFTSEQDLINVRAEDLFCDGNLGGM